MPIIDIMDKDEKMDDRSNILKDTSALKSNSHIHPQLDLSAAITIKSSISSHRAPGGEVFKSRVVVDLANKTTDETKDVQLIPQCNDRDQTKGTGCRKESSDMDIESGGVKYSQFATPSSKSDKIRVQRHTSKLIGLGICSEEVTKTNSQNNTLIMECEQETETMDIDTENRTSNKAQLIAPKNKSEQKESQQESDNVRKISSSFVGYSELGISKKNCDEEQEVSVNNDACDNDVCIEDIKMDCTHKEICEEENESTGKCTKIVILDSSRINKYEFEKLGSKQPGNVKNPVSPGSVNEEEQIEPDSSMNINEFEKLDRKQSRNNIHHESPGGVNEKERVDQKHETTGSVNIEGRVKYAKDDHTVKLGKICRICGEMKVKYDGPTRGVPKEEVVKYVKKIWKVDISEENPEVYPINVCRSCERRVKRIYLRISKKKKCEMFQDKPAEFTEHNDSDCAVCSLEVKTSPNKLQDSSNSVMEDIGIAQEETICLPRRNSARKRNLEEREASIKSMSTQINISSGFDNTGGLQEHDYTQDETQQQFLVMPKKLKGRTPYKKQSLSSVKGKYIRQDRLKPLIAHIDHFCELHKENKTEVLFFLLIQSLRNSGDRVREGLVEDVWNKRGHAGTTLSQEECLAKRILLKQSKDQYRKEYTFYKEKLDLCVLKPPFLLDRLEKTYFPENLEYYVTEGHGEAVVHFHPKASVPSFLSLSQTEGGGRGEGLSWRVMGVRWHYIDVLAKTVEELWGTLEKEVGENMYIQADVTDYIEERRDATTCDKSSDQAGHTTQPKMVNYMFSIQAMYVFSQDKMIPVYTVEPNAFMYRPLMKAIMSERGTLQPTLTAIEAERTELMNKMLHIKLPSTSTLRVVANFTSPVVEMRKDYRNLSGLNLWSLRRIPMSINRYGSMCLELKRSWLASSPRLVSVGTVITNRTKCSRCGHEGHNIRKCSMKNEDNEAKGQPRKRPSKHRSAPITTDTPAILSLPSEIIEGNFNMESTGRSSKASKPTLQLPPACQVPPITTTADQDSSIVNEILWASSNVPSTDSYSILTPAPPSTFVSASSTMAPVVSCSSLIPSITTAVSCSSLVPSVVSSQASSLPIVAGSGVESNQSSSSPMYVWTYTLVPPLPTTTQSHQSPPGPQQIGHVTPIESDLSSSTQQPHLSTTQQFILSTTQQNSSAYHHSSSTQSPLSSNTDLSSHTQPHLSLSLQPHLSTSQLHLSSNLHLTSNIQQPLLSSNTQLHPSCTTQPHISSCTQPQLSSNAQPPISSNTQQPCLSSTPHISTTTQPHLSSTIQHHLSSTTQPHLSSTPQQQHLSSTTQPHLSSSANQPDISQSQHESTPKPHSASPHLLLVKLPQFPSTQPHQQHHSLHQQQSSSSTESVQHLTHIESPHEAASALPQLSVIQQQPFHQQQVSLRLPSPMPQPSLTGDLQNTSTSQLQAALVGHQPTSQTVTIGHTTSESSHIDHHSSTQSSNIGHTDSQPGHTMSQSHVGHQSSTQSASTSHTNSQSGQSTSLLSVGHHSSTHSTKILHTNSQLPVVDVEQHSGSQSQHGVLTVQNADSPAQQEITVVEEPLLSHSKQPVNVQQQFPSQSQ